MLPAGVTALLDAFTAAARGGRAITDGVLKNAVDRMWSAYREFENALKTGEDGYQADLTGSAPFLVEVATNEGRKSAAAFARKIAEDVENQGVLLEERERTVLEDSLLTALAQQIHSRVLAAKDLVAAMDADTRSKPMSSGMAIGISWVRSEKRTEQQAAVSRMLDRDAAGLGPDGLAELRALLRAMIHDHRASNPRDTYREVLAAVLDYRSWHAFELQLLSPGSPPQRLTRKKHSEMSGGEKSAAIHMPLFAAANALYSSSKPTCPRMVALDEAFAGIDDTFKPELLGLTVKFDLDLFMTGHDLWVRYPTVPLIAHYDMKHDKAAHALSTLLVLWDGEQLIDADAGFAGNEDLAAELLGFRPTRHVPAQAGGTLVTAVEEDLDEDDGRGVNGAGPSLDRYRGPEYRRLLAAARRSLERTGGQLTGRISIAAPDDAERKAIIGVTGVHQPAGTKRMTVRLAELDAALSRATGLGLAGVLAALGEPLRNRPAETAASLAACPRLP